MRYRRSAAELDSKRHCAPNHFTLGTPPITAVDSNSAPSKIVPLGLALLVVGGVSYWALSVFRDAHDVAVHSYLESVCSAVEEYRAEHGQYPTDLGQISAANLDYDLGIPLASLTYDADDSGMSVSYAPTVGKTIVCTRTANND